MTPSTVAFTHCTLGLVALGLALLASGCPSGPSAGEDEGSSSSASSSTTQACSSGEMQTCTCAGGGGGLQVCNVAGSGFGPCECAAGTTVDDTATTSATTSTLDSTGATTSGPTESSTSTSESSTGETSLGYGPCFAGDGDCLVPGEICVGTIGGDPQTVCSLQGCSSAADCPAAPAGATNTPECADITSDGVTDCHLPCEIDDDCPAGMICFLDAGPACIWPTP